MKDNIRIRKIKDRLFHILILTITCSAILVLFVLVGDLVKDGFETLDWQFITSYPSMFAKKAGILPALVGSIYIILLTIIFAVPIGLSTAVYLEEYAKDNGLTRFIKINISNLSGTPSIVYGLLGLAVFVKILGFGRSILAGALTMSLVVLPTVIVSSQEALKAVPQYLRQGSFAMGATKWQTIRKVVLPSSLPGVFTGVILAISRALGESAPLLIVGAFSYVAFLPQNVFDSFMTLPIQIYLWIGQPKAEFREIASSGIIVLLILLLGINSIAIILRNKFQKKIE